MMTRDELWAALRALPPPAPSPMDWVCPECGSDEIQAPAWVDLHTGLDTGDEGPTSDYWCCNCEDHTRRLVRRNEWVPE